MSRSSTGPGPGPGPKNSGPGPEVRVWGPQKVPGLWTVQLYEPTNADAPTITRVQAREGSAITKLLEPLTEHNWMAWREHMKRVFFGFVG